MRDQKARTEKLRNNIALEEVEVYHVTFGLHTIVAHTHTRNRALSEFCLQNCLPWHKNFWNYSNGITMANVMAVCILNRLLLNGLAVFRSSKTCHAGGSYYKLITCGTRWCCTSPFVSAHCILLKMVAAFLDVPQFLHLLVMHFQRPRLTYYLRQRGGSFCLSFCKQDDWRTRKRTSTKLGMHGQGVVLQK